MAKAVRRSDDSTQFAQINERRRQNNMTPAQRREDLLRRQRLVGTNQTPNPF